MLNAGEFTKLQTYMEQRVTSLATAKTADLFYLCQAYSKAKNYAKLFPCLTQMDANIQRGDFMAPNGFVVPNGAVEEDFLLTSDPRYQNQTLNEAVRAALREVYEDASFYPSLARGQAYLELGDYSKAISESRKARKLAQDMKRPNSYSRSAYWNIESVGLLALAHALNGDKQDAAKFAAELEAIDVPLTGSAIFKSEQDTELAKVYMALGQYEAARRVSSGFALLSFIASSGEGERLLRFVVIPKRFIYCKSSYETGHVKEAKEGYDELLAKPETQANGEIYWLILFDRGRIAEGENNHQQAIDFYKRAVEVIEQQRSTINTEASRIGFVGDKQQVYHRLVSSLIAEGQPAQAFEYVERAKARALVDLLASKQDFAIAPSASQQIVSLVKEVDRMDEDLHMPASSSEESSRRSARGVQVKANLRTAAPELASLVMVTETASSAIQALLESDETLLEYYYQGADLYAFVVTRERVHAVKLNGANLITDVEQFRKSLEDPKSSQTGELTPKLYGRLIQPMAAQVTAKRLLIVGHGALHYLPFAALSDGSGYMVDRYSIRLLPSASVLQFLKGRQAQKAGTLLAFGNPDLGDRRYDLKFAEEEVQTIAKTFPNSKVLLRQNATKSAFKMLGPQFSYLHLATHGKFDPDTPLKSGLLLASDAQGEGFLNLGDLYSMRLNADLVTLSACETGLGKVSNGDDVVGLTRGFLYAGSNSIGASLWEVDDLATSLLMTEFYANLKRGDKREALRQAQLATKAKYPHPYYWAAFQLTGLP